MELGESLVDSVRSVWRPRRPYHMRDNCGFAHADPSWRRSYRDDIRNLLDLPEAGTDRTFSSGCSVGSYGSTARLSEEVSAEQPLMLRARLLSGKEAEVDLRRCGNVAEVRSHLMDGLGVDRARSSLKLLSACVAIEDTQSLSELVELVEEGAELVAVVQQLTEWFPQGDFEYHGRLVEKIASLSSTHFVIHFTDGRFEQHAGSPLLNALFAAIRVAPMHLSLEIVGRADVD